jgi:hypothetical protein
MSTKPLLREIAANLPELCLLIQQYFDIVDYITLADRPISMDDNARPHRARIEREFRQQKAVDTF